jgi:elongation factor G
MNSQFNRRFYRETVAGSGAGEGRVICHRGGRDLYAHVKVAVHALGRGQGRAFAWNAGTGIPARFASAIAEGIENALNAGVMEGFEVTDVQMSVEDGSYHDVDSTEATFREAAEKATTDALRQAHPLVLEAVVSVRVDAPEGRTTKIVPASQAASLIGELLEASGGRANIEWTEAGFQPRLPHR